MNDNPFTPADRPIVHWIFTSDEWKVYKKISGSGKGFFTRVAAFFAVKKFKDPHVMITRDAVHINGQKSIFRDAENILYGVEVRERKDMNIIHIRYTERKNNKEKSREIKLPVPRGKLREAIALQERLHE